jgi:hypothetical protein
MCDNHNFLYLKRQTSEFVLENVETHNSKLLCTADNIKPCGILSNGIVFVGNQQWQLPNFIGVQEAQVLLSGLDENRFYAIVGMKDVKKLYMWNLNVKKSSYVLSSTVTSGSTNWLITALDNEEFIVCPDSTKLEIYKVNMEE